MKPVQVVLTAIVLLGAFSETKLSADRPIKLSSQDVDFFESKIRPVLIEHCYECHSHEADMSEGNLYLDSAAAIDRGGQLGPSLVPGNAEKSLLYRAVRYDRAGLQMPPEGKLSAEQIGLLKHWIERGAPDPRADVVAAETAESNEASPMDIDPKSHWAFVAPRRTGKKGGENAWGHPDDLDVIDGIAREVATAAGLDVSPACDDIVLIRRLAFDLTGLPPTLNQVNAFAESSRPDKTQRLVDQLLSTPEFAERFARHWMDVARYADTVGYSLAGKERRLVGSERYRDWLIKAFSDDLPYDEMVRLQLAADRFDPENESGHLDAMGFLTIGRRFLNRFDIIDDRIDVITRGLLGMTVTCARCHDHKFDPIPTTDYYSLLGVLQSSEQPKDGPSPLMMRDKKKPSDSHVFLRGQPGNRGKIAPRQYLTALGGSHETRFTDGSGRLELAEKIIAPENPLLARVFVNRIWAHLIGRPMVDSPSDFGVRTLSPPLVRVLDELSAEFATHWSVKRLVRRIVLTRVYQQDAIASSESIDLDPDNRMAARGNRKRRGFESMRDAMLSVTGQLDGFVGGEPVEVHLNSFSPRRTIYAMIDRQNLPSLFRTFDFASPDAHAARRYTTTVPQQALFLLNHPQSGSLASSLADQVREEHSTMKDQVTSLFSRVFARLPSSQETSECIAFLDAEARRPKARFSPKHAWRYGTSPVNQESRASQFRPLPVFSGSSWQDAEKLPADSVFSYASIGLENGHPGPKHAVVRRWVAPANGIVSLNGMVGHRSKQGDGVELSVWIGDSRIWRATHKSNNRPFNDLSGRILAGQTVDFVVSPNQSDSFDSFFLRTQISLRANDGTLYEGDSKRDFSGPLPADADDSLDRLSQLAQTLLLSNEFLFVD